MLLSFTPYLLLQFDCEPRIYALKTRYHFVTVLIIVWIKIVNNNDNNDIKPGAIFVHPLNFWGEKGSHGVSEPLISEWGSVSQACFV